MKYKTLFKLIKLTVNDDKGHGVEGNTLDDLQSLVNDLDEVSKYTNTISERIEIMSFNIGERPKFNHYNDTRIILI